MEGKLLANSAAISDDLVNHQEETIKRNFDPLIALYKIKVLLWHWCFSSLFVASVVFQLPLLLKSRVQGKIMYVLRWSKVRLSPQLKSGHNLG